MERHAMKFSVLGDTAYEMRPYQVDAIDKAIDWLYVQGNKSGILQLATGTGKTALIGGLIRKLYQESKISTRVLFLAHRTELITQSYGCFEKSGLAPGREQASHTMFGQEYDPQVVCGTVQTVHARLEDIPPDTFDLIVVDECHTSSSPTYLRVLNHFTNAKILGVTATIDRADRKSLSHLTEVIYRYSLWDGIREGFLSPIKFVRCSAGANLKDCRTIGKSGDFDQSELGNRIQPHIEMLANALRVEIGHKKSIVFMPCVKSSQAMASALNQLGIGADWVSGDRSTRSTVIQSHKTNKITTLVNCQLLGEGYDDPSIECVVPRPTRSRIAYAQQVGRGTRIFPGKTCCRVIDFDHLTDMDLIGPGSLAELTAAEESEFNRKIDNDNEVNLWDAVEQAKESVLKSGEELKVRVRSLEIQYRRVEVDPFEAVTMLGVRPDFGASYGERATGPQVSVLQRMGIQGADTTSKTQASRIISAACDRRADGLATLRQLSTMIKLGVDRGKARRMSFQDASAIITERLAHG